MEKILSVVKCAICNQIMKSPKILPCFHTFCEMHFSEQTNDVIRCHKCGVEHQIPTNGFETNYDTVNLIKSGVASLNFGGVHKEANKSCESLEEALKEFQVFLKEFQVFLTQEELRLKKATYLSTDEFKEESKKFESQMKIAELNLDSWIPSLNKMEFDEKTWKRIKEESDQQLKRLTEESKKLKKKLPLKDFDKYQKSVNSFKRIKTNSIFEYVNRNFLASRIIDQSLAKKFDELLKKKDLNDQKWSLLYQGSRDGFEASNFHSLCDHKPNTLTIVKSTNENIFGGFTSAEWKSSTTELWQEDKSAFIFSLINNENRPLIFEHSSIGIKSIGSYTIHGPLFGCFYDLLISDCSNNNTYSFSNLGSTYTHPLYPKGSKKAKTILAGTNNFQVEEIEVFQMQH